MSSLSKTEAWWYDSGASVHVCSSKSSFKDYNVVDGHESLLGNYDSVK